MRVKTVDWLIILLFFISPASAWTIDNPSYVYHINNVNITFPTPQTYDSIEWGFDYIKLNGDIFQITPSSDWVNVSILFFDSNSKTFTEISPNTSVTTSNVLGGFFPDSKIIVHTDNVITGSLSSNNTGNITYTTNGGNSHKFSLVLDLPSPQVPGTNNNLQWWALVIIFLAVVGLAMQMQEGKKTLGILIALCIFAIIISIISGML